LHRPVEPTIEAFRTVSHTGFSETPGFRCKIFVQEVVLRRSGAQLYLVHLHFLRRYWNGGSVKRVEEWHDFFLAVAGAAAVLAGLVFVGVSINLDMIMSNPGYGLPGRALEALVLLVAVLIATILLLVPAQGMRLAGAEVLAVGVVDWAAVVTIQLLGLRNWRSSPDPSFRWHLVQRVVLCQLATLPIVATGVGVMGWGVGGLYWLVVGVVLSFLVAVADAWVLLVEIHR
jgi:hypothetical protein